jgi:hypothetical protein
MDDSGGLPTQPDSEPTLSRAVILAVLASSAAVAGFAISTQSYWIDEATSLIVAMSSSPTEAWKYAQAVSGSTIQMPLYHAYLYLWHKMFGSGEWAMRASNIPWFILAQLAFLVLLRHRPKLALLSCLLAAVSPTIWTYLDETRPYAMQYAAACWLVAGLLRFSSPHAPTTPVRGLTGASVIALIVLFSSSPLGAVWAGGFLAAFIWLRFSGTPDTQGHSSAPPAGWRSLAVFLVGVLLISVYYFLTWPAGGEGYHRGGMALVSIPYIAYDFLGFSGYGPGKLELRGSALGSMVRNIPALLPLALVLAVLVVSFAGSAKTKRPGRRPVIAWLLALLLPSLVILVAFVLSSYRALPRHFIPALPAVIVALSALAALALESKSVIWRATAVLLPLLWLGSSLNLRWQGRHAKDDYRAAASIAAKSLADNKEVWWAADAAAAYVYLTPVALENVPGRAWAMQAPSWDAIRFKFPPRVIVISKPDIYDPQGAVARYAAENRFAPALQLQAFTIFTREGDTLPDIGQP